MLEIGKVLRKTSAGGLHACNDAAQARRLGEAAAVIVKGVGNVLLAKGGTRPPNAGAPGAYLRQWTRMSLVHALGNL